MESSPSSHEHKLDYDAWIADAQARLEHQVQLAQSALKGLMIVNGGAIIALFTFIGSNNGRFDHKFVWWAFGSFTTGIFLTLLATTLGFFGSRYVHEF